MGENPNKRSAALIASAMMAGVAISPRVMKAAVARAADQPAAAPARAKASNGRTITTREERRQIAAEAHRRGIKLGKTGKVRTAASPTVRGAIDQNHIAAAQRDRQRALEIAQHKQAATVLVSDPLPGRR